jgi:hypothetical protein
MTDFEDSYKKYKSSGTQAFDDVIKKLDSAANQPSFKNMPLGSSNDQIILSEYINNKDLLAKKSLQIDRNLTLGDQRSFRAEKKIPQSPRAKNYIRDK